MMNKELKPCPFCGGEAKIETYPYTIKTWVLCSDLNCKQFHYSHGSKESAIEAWNTRHETKWQTIDSAPRDGTEVLVWANVATVQVVHIAWYRSKQEWEDSGQYCGGWQTLDEWEGWWSYTRGSLTQEKLEDYRSPTHWMPLPPPPESEGGCLI